MSKIFSPTLSLLIYLSSIFIYALIYLVAPALVGEQELSFVKSIYFSSVTITTLGYGEITPKTQLGMLITASEAIWGIVIIGMFLNGLSQAATQRVVKSQKEEVTKRYEEKNIAIIGSYCQYLGLVISMYKLSLAELTTPMDKRFDEPRISIDCPVSSLVDMYQPSVRQLSGINKSVLRLYYEKTDLLTGELKYFLSTFDLDSYPDIRTLIHHILSGFLEKDCRDSLLIYEKNDTSSLQVKEIIKKIMLTCDDTPNPHDYSGNLFLPVAILHSSITAQAKMVEVLENKLMELTAKMAVVQ